MGLGDPVGGFSQTYMNWFNSMPKAAPVPVGPVGQLGAPVDGFSATYKAFRDSGGGPVQSSSLAPDDLQLGAAVGGFSDSYEKWLNTMPETPPPPLGPINGLGDPIGGFSQKYIDYRDGKS